MVAAAKAASGRPGVAAAETLSGTTGNARSNISAASAGSTIAMGTANASRRARPCSAAGSAMTKNRTFVPVSRPQARSVSSGPIPAGSPIVIARGKSRPCFVIGGVILSVQPQSKPESPEAAAFAMGEAPGLLLRRARQTGNIGACLDVAQSAKRQLHQNRLIARDRRRGDRIAEGARIVDFERR